MRQLELHTDLIIAFRAGDQKAMSSLFSMFYKPLALFAGRMLKDRLAAEDVVEESFIKLWHRHEDFETLQNIKAFLYITTRNACLNLLKQMNRESLTKKQYAYLTGDKEEFVLNEMIRAEVLREILEEIEKLPGQCRKIFKLSYLEGMKNQEIADKLSISIHTVKNQKARAI